MLLLVTLIAALVLEQGSCMPDATKSIVYVITVEENEFIMSCGGSIISKMSLTGIVHLQVNQKYLYFSWMLTIQYS